MPVLNWKPRELARSGPSHWLVSPSKLPILYRRRGHHLCIPTCTIVLSTFIVQKNTRTILIKFFAQKVPLGVS